MTDFSANASLYETDYTSNDESNCCSPPQMKPSRNFVNICICRAPKDVFDQDIDSLVLDVEKHQSRSQIFLSAGEVSAN